jgi:hypothetical protein
MFVVVCLICFIHSCIFLLMATWLLSCYGLLARIHSCFVSLGIIVCIIS